MERRNTNKGHGFRIGSDGTIFRIGTDGTIHRLARVDEAGNLGAIAGSNGAVKTASNAVWKWLFWLCCGALLVSIGIGVKISQASDHKTEQVNTLLLNASQFRGQLKLRQDSLATAHRKQHQLARSLAAVKSSYSSLRFGAGKPVDPSCAIRQFDKNWLVFFRTKAPVKLHSVKVAGETSGYLRISVYNTNHQLVARSNQIYYSGGKRWQKLRLNLELPQAGTYYLKLSGDVRLSYEGSGYRYHSRSNETLALLGVASSKDKAYKSSYYQYYYNWEYSVLSQ